MNETVLNALYERRSCKCFRPEQIKDEELNAVLKAGTMAPTGRNSQSPTMVVVQDADTIALMSRLNAAVMGMEGDPFYGAPTVVVVFGDTQQMTWFEDGCLVMGNLLNAAPAAGLGGCWIHRARQTFETPEGRELMRRWGLPEHYIGIGNCILGYPAGEPKPRQPRKANYIIRG